MSNAFGDRKRRADEAGLLDDVVDQDVNMDCPTMDMPSFDLVNLKRPTLLQHHSDKPDTVHSFSHDSHAYHQVPAYGMGFYDAGFSAPTTPPNDGNLPSSQLNIFVGDNSTPTSANTIEYAFPPTPTTSTTPSVSTPLNGIAEVEPELPSGTYYIRRPSSPSLGITLAHYDANRGSYTTSMITMTNTAPPAM